MEMLMRLLRWVLDLALMTSLFLMLFPALSFCRYVSTLNSFLSFFSTSTRNIKGKVVVITGASSGIGQCMAWEYARRGAKLVLVARRKSRLEQVADECRVFGAQDVVVCSADLTNYEDCRKTVDVTISNFGQMDVLVNNAGTAEGELFEEWENVADHKKVMDIDFWGHVHTTQFALEHLRRSRGQIVVTSSMSAMLPFPYLTIYSAAKGALMNFFETLRVEELNKISITVASPGFVESELTTKELPGKMPNWFPVPKTEGAARDIVEGSLNKESRIITPRWYGSSLIFRAVFPETVEWVTRVLLLGKPPSAIANNICNIILGNDGGERVFEMLKLA